MWAFWLVQHWSCILPGLWWVVSGQKTPGGVNDDLKNQFDDAAMQTNQALAHIRAAQGRPGDEEGEDQSAAQTSDDSPGEKVSGGLRSN